MTLPLELKQFAYHYVDQKSEAPVFSEHEQPVVELPDAIQSFLLEMVAKIWDAPDAGSTRSARFVSGEEGDPPARELLRQVCEEEDSFFEASCRLASLLHERSHPNASPGVLAVMRLERPEDGARFAALVKIRYKDVAFVRLNTGDRPRLEVEEVENILLREIQKGALYPHPDKSGYDLKVIDAQAREDPAAYFTEKFLGCTSKKSDELQVKKLAPVLERYAEEKEIELVVEKMDDVLHELRQQSENISLPVLVEAVAEQELFGDQFEEQDFEAYLEEQGLADLDIPVEEFQSNRRSSRRLVYRFIDPEYEGLEISGPPEAFQNVLSSENGLVTFKIQVTSDGFRFRYQ